ncbi:MAG: hypothetical protein BroJett026_05960 [Betaproteobacteria bacterium]|nr:MAG: hypothetical protein BroJett026_05960 [Betaproteobacteria bacterium]
MSETPVPPIRRCLVVTAVAAAAALAALPAAPGPGAVEATMPSTRDCTLRYRLHAATPAAAQVVAIVAHGYLRDGSYMTGWAEALAQAGIPAVTVDLCASIQADGRPADDGADLVAVRRALGASQVLYVGVSAGGLAALVAASEDPAATRGVLLLDPVNAGGQARSAAGRVRAPVAALVARSQVCNAWRNFDPALETLADATIVRIPGASHCDFEWPGDRLCRVLCVATNSRAERDRAQARIRSLGVSFLAAAASDRSQALADWRGDIGPD